MGLGALLVLCGVLYMARATIWRGSLSRPAGDTLEPPRRGGGFLGLEAELARRYSLWQTVQFCWCRLSIYSPRSYGCRLTTPDVTRRANWTTSL